MAGRVIDQNIHELEGAFVQYDIVGRDAALLVLDFLVAFPSLDRRFMIAVLGRMGVPRPLCLFIAASYHELVTDVFFAGEKVAELPMASGI